MTMVSVEYHREADRFWADSPDVPGWVAAGDTLDEVRQLVAEGLPFYLEQDDVEIRESMDGAPVVSLRMTASVFAPDLTWFGSGGGATPAPIFVGEPARLQTA